MPFQSTPNRKRKRAGDNLDETPATGAAAATTTITCFANAGFSSTPKKLIGKRRVLQPILKEQNTYWGNPCLEVKSIAAIAKAKGNAGFNQAEQKTEAVPVPINPYEVVRKPPKKKKREAEFEEACFENPALNLDLPEKQFNPFEVPRPAASLRSPQSVRGFVNAALNLRTEDVPAARNPFEIARTPSSSAYTEPASVGVANLGLEEPATSQAQPSGLKLILPFTPTVGCRINFGNLPLTEITPSKLLAEKLVFSPEPNQQQKRSLGSISEESTVSIGKELDRYQLELENSINEAKWRKAADEEREELYEKSPPGAIQTEARVICAHRLDDILEVVEEEEEEIIEITATESAQDTTFDVKESINRSTTKLVTFNVPTEEHATFTVIATPEQTLQKDTTDVAYASDTDDDDAEPAPFVRAYRTANGSVALTVSKESLNSHISQKSIEVKTEETKKTGNVKGLIRKSIRKLMHPMQSQNKHEKNPQTNEESTSKDASYVSYASDLTNADLDSIADLDFKAPAAPFVRAYRTATGEMRTSSSKESLNSNKTQKSLESNEDKKHKSNNMTGLIRKSIRKLMHTNATESSNNHKQPPVTDEKTSTPMNSQPHNIITSIRHSLRRRPPQKQRLVEECDDTVAHPAAEISIIDASEQRMKLKSHEQLTNAKPTLRGSIRRSARDAIKSIFHKDEYIF